MKPHHCMKVVFSDTVTMDELDSICRDCKHRMRLEQGKSSGILKAVVSLLARVTDCGAHWS